MFRDSKPVVDVFNREKSRKRGKRDVEEKMDPLFVSGLNSVDADT